VTSYNISARQIDAGVVLLKVSFGEPADNTVIVRDAVNALAECQLSGGKTVYVNGPASLPVAMVIAHGVCHLFTEVACFDPKLQGFVVAISHGGRPVGTLIPASAVE
jgi:CRISPR-associated protein Csx3